MREEKIKKIECLSLINYSESIMVCEGKHAVPKPNQTQISMRINYFHACIRLEEGGCSICWQKCSRSRKLWWQSEIPYSRMSDILLSRKGFWSQSENHSIRFDLLTVWKWRPTVYMMTHSLAVPVSVPWAPEAYKTIRMPNCTGFPWTFIVFNVKWKNAILPRSGPLVCIVWNPNFIKSLMEKVLLCLCL